jgi:hypothetical protein
MGGLCSTHMRDEKRILDAGGKPEGKGRLGRPERRWIILEWILGKYFGTMWTGCRPLFTRSLKCGEFLD